MTDGLVSALARAQAAFEPIVKNRTNSHFNSKYSDLSAVLASVRPVLAAEGIALVQTTEITDDGVELVTALLHGEERLASRWPLPVDGLGSQQIGSLLSYMRRYQISALLGVAPDDDDDGNASKDVAHSRPAARAQLPAPPPKPSGPISQPDKPVVVMTMSEIIAYARKNGIPLPSGSKAELIRHLEPLVRAQTGEEPFALEGAEPIDAKDDVTDKPFQPKVAGEGEAPRQTPVDPSDAAQAARAPSRPEPSANPATGVKDELRLLKPDARASVRRGD